VEGKERRTKTSDRGKESVANTGSFTHLVQLPDHRGEFLVVLQDFVELSHRVGAELVVKTRHVLSGAALLSACVLLCDS